VANLLFYLVSLGAVVGSFGVVSSKNPIASVLSLLVTFFCLATIYLLAGFQFLAAAQILVYAGAIMVLFLFVIMLLNLGGSPRQFMEASVLRARKLPIVLAIGIGMLVVTFLAVLNQERVEAAAGDGPIEADTIEGLAELLFGSYLLPFEAASVLLLAAAVAVMVLAKREGRSGGDSR
jgi:NADH-quinone oxidoreductase subunit J